MKAKICYKDEIHRISNLPTTLQDLIQLVSTIFHSPLPQSWVLQYTDSDSDILVNEEKDYAEFRNSGLNGSSMIPKLHVISDEMFKPAEIVSEEGSVIEAENEEEEEYQVIQKEEEKPEGIIEIKEESIPMQAILEIESPLIPKIIEVQEEDDIKSPKKQISIEIITREPSEQQREEQKKEEEPVKVTETREPVSTLLESQKEKNEVLETGGKKICIDVNDLEKIVTGMIDKSLPKIAELAKQQLDEVNNQSVSAINYSELSAPVMKSSGSKAVHFDVRCNECLVSPIIGIRYKCTECSHYNSCEYCEQVSGHPHNFIKIKQPEEVVYNKPEEIKAPITANEWMKFNPNCDSLVDELRRVRNNGKKPEKKNVQDPLKEAEKTGYDLVIEKAEKLFKCFPKEDFDNLCIYVSEAPEDMTLEELVENFKLCSNE